MNFKEKEIIDFLKAKKTGNKGWYLSSSKCPYCGKENHLAFIFNSKISSFVCKKCNEKGTLHKLLKYLNRLDLIVQFKSFTPESVLENPFLNGNKKVKKVIDLNLPIKTKPLGFKRIFKNDYLDSRGFVEKHYQNIEIGISTLDFFLKNEYIIFICKNDEGNCIGWVARSIREKSWIKEYNKKAKEKGEMPYLRWRNSTDTDFSKILFGSTEIVDETTTVILVEGITSKANVDKLLNLYDSPEIKCCCTFGKKISNEQIETLKRKNIKNIIVLYDPDAVKEIKEYSFELFFHFFVEIGYIYFKKENGEDKDPGDLNLKELLEILNSLENPLHFKNKIEIK